MDYIWDDGPQVGPGAESKGHLAVTGTVGCAGADRFKIKVITAMAKRRYIGGYWDVVASQLYDWRTIDADGQGENSAGTWRFNDPAPDGPDVSFGVADAGLYRSRGELYWQYLKPNGTYATGTTYKIDSEAWFECNKVRYNPDAGNPDTQTVSMSCRWLSDAESTGLLCEGVLCPVDPE